MNHGGDAAEQVVRMSLGGVEMAAKITGGAAKEIALLLLAALKGGEKDKEHMRLKGKTGMESMLKSGKPLEIFSLKIGDLAKFSECAKRYGIVYSVLKNPKDCPDGLCDIMVKAEDSPKISRIIERYGLNTVVEKASVEQDEQEVDKNAHKSEKSEVKGHPLAGKPPSERSSKTNEKGGGTVSSKKSTIGELEEIKKSQTAKRTADGAKSVNTHKKPQRLAKSKPKGGRRLEAKQR